MRDLRLEQQTIIGQERLTTSICHCPRIERSKEVGVKKPSALLTSTGGAFLAESFLTNLLSVVLSLRSRNSDPSNIG